MTQTQTNEKPKKKTGDVIITVILILAIAVAIACSYSAYVTKAGNGVPSIFGYEPFSVQSDSMSPFFYQGDLVIDKKVTDPSTLQVGDVITFWTIINGYKVLNTHRIVAITDYGDGTYYFDTKGDANPVNDTSSVHSTDVVGIYKFHLKGVGSALDFLQTSKGFFICIVVPVGLFFLYQLIAFFKVLNEYKTEKIRAQIQAENEAARLAAANAAEAPKDAPTEE